MVEPILFKIWAEGMLRASYSQLYTVHFMALLVNTGMFLGGFVLRALLTGSILFLGYTIFEEPLTLAFIAVFPSFEMKTAIMTHINESNFWVYKLLGYVILIKSVLFIFGDNFKVLLQETTLYLLMIVTAMIPLKWIAQCLVRENFFAQFFAKSSLMSLYMTQTLSAAPSEIDQKYTRIFGLYKESNDENARKELEELCAISINQ